MNLFRRTRNGILGMMLALVTGAEGAQAWQAPLSESLPSALLQVIDEAPAASPGTWSRTFAGRLAPAVSEAIRAEWGRDPSGDELTSWAAGWLTPLTDLDARARFRRQARRAEQSIARWKRRLDPTELRGVLVTFGGEIRVKDTSQGPVWVFPLERLGDAPDEIVITHLVKRDLDERAPLPADPERRWTVLRELQIRYRVHETLEPGPASLASWSRLPEEQVETWMAERRAIIREVREAWRDTLPIDETRERFTLALGFDRVLRHQTWQACTSWDLPTWNDQLWKTLDSI